MKISDYLYALVGDARDKEEVGVSERMSCPDESDVLSYLENGISSRNRGKMESHFAECDGCRELLTIYMRISGESELPEGPMTEEVVRDQAARILVAIKDDEFKQSQAAAAERMPDPSEAPRPRTFISYGQLAMIIAFFAIAVVAIYWAMMPPPPGDAAMKSLAMALKDKRQIAPQISGGIPHSPLERQRGAESSEDIQFNIAENHIQSAKNSSASPEDRMILARIYLARNKNDDVDRALEILRDLSVRGVESPELYNDTGVALFLRRRYPEAIAEFSKALEKTPNYTQSLFNRALAEKQAGLRDDARRDWERFLDLSNDEKWKEEARERIKGL